MWKRFLIFVYINCTIIYTGRHIQFVYRTLDIRLWDKSGEKNIINKTKDKEKNLNSLIVKLIFSCVFFR